MEHWRLDSGRLNEPQKDALANLLVQGAVIALNTSSAANSRKPRTKRNPTESIEARPVHVSSTKRLTCRSLTIGSVQYG